MRTVVPIKRMVQKPPSRVYQVTGRKQHQQSRSFAQEAAVARHNGAWRVKFPQNLQAGIPKGLSGLAETMERSHQGIIGQKRHRHSQTPHNGVLLCHGRLQTDFRVRPAMFLEPESFGCPFPFGGAGLIRRALAWLSTAVDFEQKLWYTFLHNWSGLVKFNSLKNAQKEMPKNASQAIWGRRFFAQRKVAEIRATWR